MLSFPSNSSRPNRALRGLVVAALAGAGLVAISAAPASATLTPTAPTAAGALTLAQTMAAPGTTINSASYVTVPAVTGANAPNGTSDVAIAGFPSPATPFSILTTGRVNAIQAPVTTDESFEISPNVFPATGRGNSARDTSVLKVDLTAPAGTNCLSFDFKFLSEEYPDYVGQQFNDAFIAELDSSTWTAQQSGTTATITAPNNFAKDTSGNVVSINSTGIGGMTSAAGAGTRFTGPGGLGGSNSGGATGLLRANVQVTPGTHSLYLSIFDQGDAKYDSAVFLTNLRTSFRPNPTVNCQAGTQPVNTAMTLTPATHTSAVGTTHTVTANLKDSNGVAIPSSQITFNVTGSNTTSGVATTNAAGNASFSYTGSFAGTDTISACYQPTGSCLATASASQFWNGPAVITADTKSKVYGQPDPTFTYSVSGLANPSLVTEPTCSVSGPHENVGSYPITCTGADAGSNQNVTYVAGTFTVTPAAVTVTADNQSKTYGAADPAFTFGVSGLLGGDSLTTPATCDVTGAHGAVGDYPITCSGAAAGPNYTVGYAAGTLHVGKARVTITADSKGKTYGAGDPAFTFHVSGLQPGDQLTTDPTCTVSGAHAAAGTYPITCTGASAGGNYDVDFAPGTLTVAKAEVVVTADPKSKTYGTADPAFTATVAGLQPGDSLVTQPTCTVSGAHSNVGHYDITCSGADAGSNYTVSYETGTLAVTPAEVTITANNRQQTYGHPDPTYTFGVSGLVGGDQLLDDPTCNVTGPHTNVGTYPITCTGGDAGDNYTIAYLPGTYTVNPATATVTPVSKSKTYGDPDPAFDYTVSGLVGSDHLTSPASCTVPAPHTNVGSYTITCTGGSAGPNYDMSYVGGTLTVTKATVTVTADPATKVYGTADPAFTSQTSGLVGGDNLTSPATCGVTGGHAHVGIYPITCTGASAGGNYTVAYSPGLLTVTPATLSITADSKTKTFGTADPAFTFQTAGLVGSDALVTAPTCEPRVAHSQVGTYPILCTDADAGPDYTIEYFAGQLRVDPAGVLVSADNQTVTYGDADPAFTFTVTGLTGGDDLTVEPGCTVLGAHTAVGTYPITCMGAAAGGNYDVAYQAGTLTVLPKHLQVSADNKSIVYGDDDPAFTATVTGLVGNDHLSTDPTCTVSGAHSSVGTYPIGCHGADAGDNYTIGYVDGTLTVAAKAGVVTADDKTITFGDADPAYTFTVSGLKAGDSLAAAPTCTVSGPHANAGSYPITCTGGSAGGNYALSYQAGTLTVAKKAVTVTADNQSKVFGAPDPAFTSQTSGLLGGDTLTTPATCTVAGAHSNVGSYPINCTGANAGGNYTVGYVDGTLQVTQAHVTITADNKTKVYGGADPAFTSGVSGLVGGDTLTTPATCTVSGAHSNVGSYPITCTGANAGGNYDIGYQAGSLTVTKAELTVTADDKSKVQGNPLPTFTATTTGYVNGDGASAVTGNPALSTTATATSPAGTYPITAGIGSLAASNYTFRFVDGVLTVTSKPPTATITTPPNGAVYFQGQTVKAAYSCADEDGTVISCAGTVAAGTPINTATTGTKTFSVTATDNNGLTGTASTSYKVVPVVGECRGMAVSALGLTLADANPSSAPCAAASQEVLGADLVLVPGIPLLGIPAQGVNASVLKSTTQTAPGSSKAQSTIAATTISVAGLTIKVNGVSTSASSVLTDCSSPATLTGSSSIASVTVNGIPLIPAAGTSQSLTLPLVVGTIALNERQVSGNKITQTAVRINVLGLEIALGRSIAAASCGS